jgi:hypothetical protein|tara:strand:- start:2621 stop:3181 length:561 start_codon:yes stop_codon:yes gene_type:complete
MNEEALFQEYSTNRALQATYPDFATYRDFVMSQMPAQANDNSGITGLVNNATSSMGSLKDLGKNLIMNKLSSKMGMSFNPIGIGAMMLGGLKDINQRIQSTDFARSKTLADYLDAKRYGGIDARNAAAIANMAQARGIQKQMAQRPSSQVSARDAAMGGGGGGGSDHDGGASAAAQSDAAAGMGGY